VGVEEGVVGVLVGLASGAVEDGLHFVEAGEGAVKLVITAFTVIPAKAGIHQHGGVRFGDGGVHGSRIKSGMTNERSGADSA
jgi:hypothetical protein